MWGTVVKRWDRLLTYLCFVAFGVMSMLAPTASMDSGPKLFSFLFDAELTAAGLILLASVFTGSTWQRWVGYSMFLIGMLTIAGLVLVGSGSPVWVLVLGVAFQGIVSLRDTSEEARVSHELAELARELQEGKDCGD